MSDELEGLNPVGRGSHPERAYTKEKGITVVFNTSAFMKKLIYLRDLRKKIERLWIKEIMGR